MTSNLRRLGALAIAQFGSFVVVLIIGVFGGPGQLAQTVGDMRSEQEVRDTVADLNRRIAAWRRIPVGPPVYVRLVDSGEMAGRWRQAQAARQARPPAGSAAGAPADPGAQAGPPTSRARRLAWRLARRRLGLGRAKRG